VQALYIAMRIFCNACLPAVELARDPHVSFPRLQRVGYRTAMREHAVFTRWTDRMLTHSGSVANACGSKLESPRFLDIDIA